jgi:hypothetical protein
VKFKVRWETLNGSEGSRDDRSYVQTTAKGYDYLEYESKRFYQAGEVISVEKKLILFSVKAKFLIGGEFKLYYNAK